MAGASTVVGRLTGYRILAFELTLIIASSLKKAASVKGVEAIFGYF